MGVVGPNGSGKSTLLAALAGWSPRRGRILVCEEPELLGVEATLHRCRDRLWRHRLGSSLSVSRAAR